MPTSMLREEAMRQIDDYVNRWKAALIDELKPKRKAVRRIAKGPCEQGQTRESTGCTPRSELGGSDGKRGQGEPPGKKQPTSAIAAEPHVPPPPGKTYSPDVEKVNPKTGTTTAARVGVPAMDIPMRIDPLPNLSQHERTVEKAFIDRWEADPHGTAEAYRDLVKKSTKEGDPPTFATDDAKQLTAEWSHEDQAVRSQNRATLNTPLHQTANAAAKLAFLKELDDLGPGDEILVTVGGCGAGKGYSLKNVKEALDLKKGAKAVWDSAGDQNATENPWIQEEAEKRGIKVNYVYVHADPKTQWAHPDRGVVKRAQDPADGRMVGCRVFADSYAIGAKNMQAFHEKHADNPNASFVFIDGTAKGGPAKIDGVPEAALNVDRHELAEFAAEVVRKSDAPAHVKRGALMDERIWKSEVAARKSLAAAVRKALKMKADDSDDDYLAWLDEDRDRVNALSDLARESGITGQDSGPPPRLNPDGSLADADSDGKSRPSDDLPSLLSPSPSSSSRKRPSRKRSRTKIRRVRKGKCKPGQNPKRDDCSLTDEGGGDDTSGETPDLAAEAVMSAIGKVSEGYGKAKDAIARLGKAGFSKLPPKIQQAVLKTWAAGKWAEHKVMTGFREAKRLAVEIGKEKGWDEDQVERYTRILGTVDLVAAWTVNMPAVLAVTGSPLAAKVSSWIPIASLAYIGYSLARNPIATARAAKRLVGGKKKGYRKTRRKALNPRKFADELAEVREKAADQQDWFDALFAAALDENRTNPEAALRAATEAFKKNPRPPAEAEADLSAEDASVLQKPGDDNSDLRSNL